MQKLLQNHPRRRAIEQSDEEAETPTSDIVDRCFECDGSLERRTNERYHYLESGLKNVWLDGLVVYHCRRCREQYPEIRNIARVHGLIAAAIVEKRFALIGKEFRFLRKHMRMKAKEIAAVLGVTMTTISRWETGVERIGLANDRLMRCLYTFWHLAQGEVQEPSRLFDRIQSDFRKLSPQPRAQRIDVKIGD